MNIKLRLITRRFMRHNNVKGILCVALVVSGAWSAWTQTNAVPAFYVHFGAEGNRFLSARIHWGEPIFVGAGEYWDLKGHIELRGTNFFGDLMGGDGQQSQFYHGPMTLEKPCFAQGGAASGGAGPCFWFAISTNSDRYPIVERVRRELGLTNQPVNHPAVIRIHSPVVSTNAPEQIAPDTGLPQGHLLIDPTTGLPLRPKHTEGP